ncbi:DUF4240 domain-containing protein [Catenuloplanes atrovinosus]|uniref:DUF4240 domain-containing protein n=1 Tax=Catenuloplanes atrovinosus TaxID=137266 RepID=A0AAE3YMQ3_9ACTN|nr:DUF4240 domain-containing protein [Catenuloplanes atrovinosus]MDR7275335.1 hypothetical protein [Catenuloplanes atrovinosus]
MTDTVQGRLPTAEEEARFWALIESVWASLGDEPAALRRALVSGDDGNIEPAGIGAWLNRFHERLVEATAELTAPELVALDRVVERKLYDIDRADVHEVTDGSDDGFLYARGFIVALGRDYYEAVRADPASAACDGSFERMCYFFASRLEDRFGTWPDTGSGISRETGSNHAGWPD